MVDLETDTQTEPSFPPLLNGLACTPNTAPYEEACNGASQNLKYSAGDVLWANNNDYMRWAIVLEPEVPLSKSQQMIPLAMAAAGDCIGALTPPQVGVTFAWPNKINVNGARCGEVQAAVNTKTTASDIPDWLVIGLSLRLSWSPDAEEPGLAPDETALREEGCGDLTTVRLIESYSKHFLTWLNIWNDDGFPPVSAAWRFRLDDHTKQIDLSFAGENLKGVFAGLDENGGLLMKTDQGEMRLLELSDWIERR